MGGAGVKAGLLNDTDRRTFKRSCIFSGRMQVGAWVGEIRAPTLGAKRIRTTDEHG